MPIGWLYATYHLLRELHWYYVPLIDIRYPDWYKHTHMHTYPYHRSGNHCICNYPLEDEHGTKKLVVCRCFCFSNGVFSGSMLVFRGVYVLRSIRHVKPTFPSWPDLGLLLLAATNAVGAYFMHRALRWWIVSFLQVRTVSMCNQDTNDHQHEKTSGFAIFYVWRRPRIPDDCCQEEVWARMWKVPVRWAKKVLAATGSLVLFWNVNANNVATRRESRILRR